MGFTFNKTNVFDYSYPNANFSYVPCEKGVGDSGCYELTQNFRTFCIPSDYVSSSYGVCVCDESQGWTSSLPDCNFNATEPACISGPVGCSSTSAIGDFKKVSTAITFALTAYLLLRALKTLRKIYMHDGFTADFTGMVFVCTGYFTGLLTSSMVLLVMHTPKPQYHQIRDVAGAVVAMCAIGALFNMIVVFNRVLDATKTLTLERRNRMTVKQFSLFLMIGFSSCAIMIMFMFLNKYELNAIFTVLMLFLFGVWFLVGGRSLGTMIVAKTTGIQRKTGKTLLKTTTWLGSVMSTYVVLAVLFAVFSTKGMLLQTRTFQNIAMEEFFLQGMTFSGVSMFWIIQAYLGPKKKREKVTPTASTNASSSRRITEVFTSIQHKPTAVSIN